MTTLKIENLHFSHSSPKRDNWKQKQFGKYEQRVSNNEFVSHLKIVICRIIFEKKRQDKLTKKAAVNTIIDSGLCFPQPHDLVS